MPRKRTGPCVTDGCDRDGFGGDQLCHSCRHRLTRYGDVHGRPEPRPPKDRRCDVDGCDEPHEARGKCRLHYQRERLGWDVPEHVPDGRVRGRGPCRVEGCPKVSVTSALCPTHYSRWKRNPNDLGPAVGRKPRAGTHAKGPDVPCRIDGCGGFAVGRGYCSAHYHRLLRYGDPLAGRPRLIRDEMARVCANLHVGSQMGSCWEWTGRTNGRGYGRVYVRRDDVSRSVYVHRLTYEHFVGPIPDGMQIDHLCFNTLCANPLHLEPVTPTENMRRSASRRKAAAREMGR